MPDADAVHTEEAPAEDLQGAHDVTVGTDGDADTGPSEPPPSVARVGRSTEGQGGTRRRRGRGRRRSPGRTAFFVALAGTFAAMAVWSLASPLMSVPDEPVHVIKAVAAVRGQLVGNLVGPSTNPTGIVTVPRFYAELQSVPNCFHRRSTVTPSCSSLPATDSTAVKTAIYTSRYPPLYYLIVGLPSLLGASRVDVYLMRLMSSLLAALMIALAAFSVVRWSRSRLGLVGIVVATTPMVLFLGGSVNPAAFEAAAGIALWASGSVLVVEQLADPPTGLLVVVAGSASALALTRPLSPLWVALIALALGGIAGRQAIMKALRVRRVRIALAVVVVAAAVASAWILAFRSFDLHTPPGSPNAVPRSVSEANILETSFRHNVYYLPGMIGVFGWFDTYAPQFTYIVWYGLVGFLVIGAAAVGRVRQGITLLVVTVAVVTLPVVISSSQVHRYGYTWAGKDLLAFAVGLPIVASVLLGQQLRRSVRSRLTAIVCGAAALAQAAAFFEMLRRYGVGTSGPNLNIFGHPSWQPPISLAGALVAECLVLALMALVTWIAVAQSREVPAPDADPPSTLQVGVAS